MTPDDILREVARHWTLDPLPTPRDAPWPRGRWMRCPVCRSRRWQIRYWHPHAREGHHRITHRCDVHLKCTRCSAAWVHGLAIDQATFDRLITHGQHISWWQGRQIVWAWEDDRA